MHCPVGDGADSREDDGTEDCYEESMDFEALDESSEEPKEKAIDNEREDTKGEKVDRKSEDEENRFDRHIDNAPEKSKDESSTNTFHADSWNDIWEHEKRHCTDEPFEKKHRDMSYGLYLYYSTLSEKNTTTYKKSQEKNSLEVEEVSFVFIY